MSSSAGTEVHALEKSPPSGELSKQYGGNYAGGWLARLPPSWIPYVQLARLSPPAGLFLIYFPHLFGILHAAVAQRSPPSQVLLACTVMLAGSFFYSNAIHIWNDLIDAPVDKKVQRTSMRPIPRGAVLPRAAFVFTVTQAMGAAFVLLCFMPAGSALYAAPNMIPVFYYPWAKRHTHLAQVVLGIWLGWGVLMGAVAMGRVPYTVGPRLADCSVDAPTISLFLACVLWTVIYDTIYAFQDVEDDEKIGLKSLAVLLGERTKPVLWLILGGMMILLVNSPQDGEMGVFYYLFSVFGSFISLGTMIYKVDLKMSLSCWWWFRYGFWATGGLIAAGLGFEYVVGMMGRSP